MDNAHRIDLHTRHAVESQGLGDLRAALLYRLGVETEIENTGGYCMALVTYVLREEGDRYVEDVIVAAGEGYGLYYIQRMPATVWDGMEADRDPSDFDPEHAQVYGIDAALARWSRLNGGEWMA